MGIKWCKSRVRQKRNICIIIIIGGIGKVLGIEHEVWIVIWMDILEKVSYLEFSFKMLGEFLNFFFFIFFIRKEQIFFQNGEVVNLLSPMRSSSESFVIAIHTPSSTTSLAISFFNSSLSFFDFVLGPCPSFPPSFAHHSAFL